MPMEIDFLGLAKSQEQKEQHVPSDSRKPSSIRDLQNAASRLSPDLLKSIISPEGPQAAPVAPSPVKTAPLTIFYKGTISYFEATADVVENLMKMAEGGKIQQKQKQELQQQQRGILMKGFNSNGDMPLFRTKSLQRFFEKRKERLTSVAPYPTSPHSSVGDVEESVNQVLLNKNKKDRNKKKVEQSKEFSSSSSATPASMGHS